MDYNYYQVHGKKGDKMKIIKKDKVIYFFSPKNEPIDSVELDQEFWVESDDCYGGQIKTEKNLRPDIDISTMDASTGPIKVKGVKAGDAICVEILEIELEKQGVMVTSPGLGPLGKHITEPNTKILVIEDRYAIFNERLKFPLTPMVGVLGVAPEKGEIHCATPGDHGANMDTKDIKVGSKVYFPVFVDGANIAIGDLHACMGDGELSGTGVEIGGCVKMKVSKVNNLDINMPIVETDNAFMIISSDETFEKASYKGLYTTTQLVQKRLDLDFPDAYRVLSATCDIKISQIVNPLITLRVAIPKSLIPSIG